MTEIMNGSHTAGDPVLRVTDLKMHFPVRSKGLFPKTIGQVKAVDGVSFDVQPGETLGLVGENGQAAQDRQAGTQHRGELTREDRKILELDLALAEADLPVHPGIRRLDGDRCHALLPDARQRLGLTDGLELGLDQSPGPSACLDDVLSLWHLASCPTVG